MKKYKWLLYLVAFWLVVRWIKNQRTKVVYRMPVTQESKRELITAPPLPSGIDRVPLILGRQPIHSATVY